MANLISLKWKQFTCKHDWKLLHYFDDYSNGGAKEKVRIVCKNCELTRVRINEEYEGRVSRRKIQR